VADVLMFVPALRFLANHLTARQYLNCDGPFYHVIETRIANPVGGSGWHRARLIDLAIERFGEWWLVGYGNQDAGWGPELGMGITDVTNELILAGLRYGLLGVIALCAVLTTALRDIVRVHRNVLDPQRKSFCSALGTIMVAVVITWMSVSFFGHLMLLFHCVLGIIECLPNITRVQSPCRPVSSHVQQLQGARTP
jgi:hypothetical protein